MVNNDPENNVFKDFPMVNSKTDKAKLIMVKKFIEDIYTPAINVKPPFMRLLIYIAAIIFLMFLLLLMAPSLKSYFLSILILFAVFAILAFISDLFDKKSRIWEKRLNYLMKSEEALKTALRNLIQDSLLEKERNKHKEKKDE